MSEPTYISNQALPLNQNFDLLKNEGLAYIQKNSGSNWTNLNNTDPGVTILDQVCYALTELGYCTGFSIPDLLTNSKGELRLDDQFYLPAQILTSTPITCTDYRKLIIDSNPAIGNALVIPTYGGWAGVSCLYTVYIRLATAYRNSISINNLCQQVYFSLNNNRNLGDFFEMPRILLSAKVPVIGRVEIENRADFGKILAEMIQTTDQAIFPDVHPISFTQARDLGFDEDEIYEGPRLNNGFIVDSLLGEKVNAFTTLQFSQLIRKVSGVNAVSSIKFGTPDDPIYTVNSSTDELLVFDFENSIKAGYLVFTAQGVTLSWQDVQQPNISKINSVSVPKSAQNTGVPIGNFRDVNTYYSIQNTFPESFGIGELGSADGGSDIETAQAHQLRGYLTLFDQVLANQFTQLASLGTLFSFKNANSNAPFDLDQFNAQRNKLERKPAPYPAPYQVFSPTYFCQSLYNVPDIRHLLKDYQTFNFNANELSQKELDEASWKAYRNDPYNSYMKGLMNLTYHQNNNLEQRNKILNHLLARHGESPVLIDEWIKGSTYTSDALTDKVIYKSLYLQNLGLLSYYQPKALNCYTANPLLDWNNPKIKYQRDQYGFSHDFMFNSTEMNRVNKLKNSDFTNFSAIALKLNLLFGLSALYDDYLNQSTDNELVDIAVFNQMKWFISQQKGIVVLETSLLLAGVCGIASFSLTSDTSDYYTVEDSINFQELSVLRNYLNSNSLDSTTSQIEIKVDGLVFTLNKQGGELPIGNTTTTITDSIGSFQIDYSMSISEDQFNFLIQKDLRCILPTYISVLEQPQTQDRLNRFLEANLPVSIAYKLEYCPAGQLANFITDYVTWFNAYRFTNEKMPDSSALSQASIALILELYTCFST